MISPEEYTMLAQTEAFQLLVKGAEAALMNYVHLNDKDMTLESGCRAHDRRCGGEVVLNYLVTQPTTQDVARVKKQKDADSADYGA